MCVPSPCYNGGTCRIKQGVAHCECPKGFSGEHCERSELRVDMNTDILYIISETAGGAQR